MLGVEAALGVHGEVEEGGGVGGRFGVLHGRRVVHAPWGLCPQTPGVFRLGPRLSTPDTQTSPPPEGSDEASVGLNQRD